MHLSAVTAGTTPPPKLRRTACCGTGCIASARPAIGIWEMSAAHSTAGCAATPFAMSADWVSDAVPINVAGLQSVCCLYCYRDCGPTDALVHAGHTYNRSGEATHMSCYLILCS